MPKIQKPFCNFADQYNVIESYQKALKWDFGNYMPIKVRVDCRLYHGCDPLLDGDESKRRSKEIFMAQGINYNQTIKFAGLRYCQIPIKTRLSFSIVLVF